MTTTKMSFNDVQEVLSNYTGSMDFYRVTPFNDLIITEGINKFCELCECFWLVTDFIALKLYPITKTEDDRFCVVKLSVKNGSVKMSAVHDKDEPIFWQDHQKDYGKCIPAGEYEFFLIDNTLLLKSEY